MRTSRCCDGNSPAAFDFIRRYHRSERLLDLGCAYGSFLKEAQRHFDALGIEFAEDAAEYCRRCGLKVLSGMAEANMARVATVDVVTMFDVIEHLPQPRETLALCGRQLRPDGIIVITTGDFASLAVRLVGRRWRLMTPPQHLWFFTSDSVQRMAAPCELSIEHVSHPAKIGSIVTDYVPAATDARFAHLTGRNCQPQRRAGPPI